VLFGNVIYTNLPCRSWVFIVVAVLEIGIVTDDLLSFFIVPPLGCPLLPLPLIVGLLYRWFPCYLLSSLFLSRASLILILNGR
jgi:hypothetical protein